MIRKKFLYSASILASALQVCSISPSLAMDYPAYDKSGNAVGTLGVKRRDQNVLEFTLQSNQTGNYVSFEKPEVTMRTEAEDSSGYPQSWKADVERESRTASLDLSKDILLYRSSYYAPRQFSLGGYAYGRGTSIKMNFSDGNFVYSVALPSTVIDKENVKMTLGALLAEILCPKEMSKKALKKAKKADKEARIASREALSPLSDEERATRRQQATKARKAMNFRRQKRK